MSAGRNTDERSASGRKPPLAGKVAIVTGASRGIGRAIAERLAADGADVIVNYAGSRDKAEEVVAQIHAAGGRAVAVQADIADGAQVARLFEQAQARSGRIDIVVQNAGIIDSMAGSLAETPDEVFDQVFAVNTRGTFLVLREAARRIADSGRIVVLSTVITRAGYPGTAVYGGSKAAVEQFVRTLANELGPRGITVNGVLPGMTETDMMRAVMSPEAREYAIAQTALRRMGQPEDIADVVAFLAGPDGRWVTGQNLVASGTL